MQHVTSACALQPLQAACQLLGSGIPFSPRGCSFEQVVAELQRQACCPASCCYRIPHPISPWLPGCST